MVILSFGSGFNFESRDADYQQRIKEIGRLRPIQGHRPGRLFAAGQPRRGHAGRQHARLAGRGSASCRAWAQSGAIEYLAQLKHFIEFAGLGVLEHDGSYPGDMCAATTHPGHRGPGRFAVGQLEGHHRASTNGAAAKASI